MPKRTSGSDKFPVPIRLIHWSMAVLLIGMLTSGIVMHQIPLKDPGKFDLYHWHRAFGVLAFALVIIRLIIRLASQVPELPSGLPWYERQAARLAQVLLYIFMLVMPIVGYIASSAAPDFPGAPPIHSIWLFGLELPLFPVSKDYATTVFFITIHKYVGYTMIAVIVAHIGGALKHRFFDKPENDVLSKML
jgi:cytochrome b561